MSCADDNKDCCAQDNKLCSQDIMFCKVDNLPIFFAKNIFNQCDLNVPQCRTYNLEMSLDIFMKKDFLY